jgi:AraC-like DNA-binding protein
MQPMQSRKATYSQRYFSMKFAEVGCHKHYTNEVVPHAYNHVLFAMMVKGKKTIDIAGGSANGRTTIELEEGNSLFSYAPIRATSHSDVGSGNGSRHRSEGGLEFGFEHTGNSSASDCLQPSVCITVEIEREKIREIMYRVSEHNELNIIAGKSFTLAPFSIASGGRSSNINDTLKSIFQISSDGITFKDRLIELKLEELLLYTLQSDLRTTLIGNLHEYSSSVPLAYVIEYIHANLHSRLTVETLAEKANLSIPSFYRHFKSAFGFTPNDYICHKRMEEAKYLLEHTTLSIAAISDKLGYSSQQHFAKLFRSVWGVCPSSVRPKKGGFGLAK